MEMAALDVAEPWFQVERIDDQLTLITEPSVNGWLQANNWHLRGRDADLLIDCGLGVASMRDLVLDQLSTREPIVVLTHAHLDHMGSAHEFAEVWAHPAEPTHQPGRGSLVGAELERILGVEGFEAYPMPELLLDALPIPDYDLTSYELRPVAPTRYLTDGDVVDLGDRRLQVVHLPGHTPGSIALYDEEARAIFTGDVIYDDQLLDTCRGSSIPDYLQTMRRLLDMDIAIVHAGHAPSFSGDRMREIAEKYLRFRGR